MPIKKAALKAMKQARSRALRNRRIKVELKKLIKEVRNQRTPQSLSEAVKKIDRAWAKGILPKNRASRYKSRLQALVSVHQNQG